MLPEGGFPNREIVARLGPDARFVHLFPLGSRGLGCSSDAARSQ